MLDDYHYNTILQHFCSPLPHDNMSMLDDHRSPRFHLEADTVRPRPRQGMARCGGRRGHLATGGWIKIELMFSIHGMNRVTSSFWIKMLCYILRFFWDVISIPYEYLSPKIWDTSFWAITICICLYIYTNIMYIYICHPRKGRKVSCNYFSRGLLFSLLGLIAVRLFIIPW